MGPIPAWFVYVLPDGSLEMWLRLMADITKINTFIQSSPHPHGWRPLRVITCMPTQPSRARGFPVKRSFLVCLLSLWLTLSSAQALDPSKRLTQYAHTAWQSQDVAEDFHGPFTQTADGYFWFGTASGLMRFDGVKFAPYAPPDLKLPSRGYQYLLGARDGSLWIGTTNGLGRLKDGKFQWYSDPAKHMGTVKIFEDKQGTIWVTRYHLLPGEGPLCRVEGSGLHCYGKNDGIPARYAFSLTEDSAGDLWFGSAVLYRWRPGSPATVYLNELAHRQDAGQGVNDFAIGEAGTVWAAIDAAGADLGVRYLSGGKWASYVIPGFDGSKIDATALYVDRNGLLWIGTDSDGIYRVRNGKAEHYGVAEGLSGKSVDSFYEDREGNLWVRTDTGIDKFRDIPVITYSTREGLSEAGVVTVLGLQDGSLWVGNGGAIDILAHGEHSVLSAKEGLPGGSVGGLYQDHRGVIWLARGGRLMSYEHGRFKEFKRPDGSSIAERGLGAITEDANHTIWALTPHNELFRVKDQAAYLVISVSGDNRPGGYLAPDHKGGLWIGSLNGTLTYYRDGQTRTISVPAQGGDFTLMDLAVDSDDSLLLSTSQGLFRWDNQHWQVLNHRNGVPEGAVFTAIRDDVGALWLYAQRGLVRITKAEYDKWLGHSDSKLQTELFDKLDGLRPGRTVLPLQPRATKTRDGKLWFATSNVLQMVDPTQTYRNGVTPPVRIEGVIADHKDYPVAEMLRLPALTRDVEIDYTALSFTAPQKVQFRYMLLDRDSHWQDAATRRRAFYSNLGPGNYRFRVMACNNEGVWNEAGATLDFFVAPAYYQTNWFRSLCAVGFLALLWGTYRFRVRQLRRQEKKLRDVVETIPTFAWTALPDGAVDFVNHYSVEYTGLSTEKTMGSGWEAAVHPADLPHYVEGRRASLAFGEPFEHEVRFRRAANGEYRWFLSRVVPLRDSGGKIVKWYGISTDIEDRKRAEHERERLRQLEADLAHVNRVSTLGEMAASLAHEIKQPIAAAITSANSCMEWLAHEPPNLDRARAAASKIDKYGNRAAEIIDRIRSFYKKSPPQRELVDVNGIIQEILTLLDVEAKRSSVAVRTELAAGLPEVMADRVQLQQVFMNLMLNAIESMKDSGGELTVKSELHDGELQFSVSDTGVGLPTEEMEQIFSAFFTTKAQGSGMGLAISRSIVESHGGRLWATANNGRGATFQFTLPTETSESVPLAV